MTRLGQRKSMKRSKAPKTWRIHRKEKTWTVKTKPGPHSGLKSIPILLILRDYLGYTRTRKETKTILNRGLVLLDGKLVRDERRPVGIMDIIEVPKANEYYRVLPNKKGELYLHKIKKKEKDLKIFSIRGKKILKGGVVQLNLHDGTNVLGENTHKVHDMILYDLNKKEIKEHIPFKKGVLGFAVDGSNVSRMGRIIEAEEEQGTVLLKSENGMFKTLRDYVHVVGKGKPSVSIPEGI
ncbi:MAG: 30S ribosomal protein S4e [Euryarchaeota archaeon]|nr:30S ribosomal protein S4e [Euryarchaeota archaeon]